VRGLEREPYRRSWVMEDGYEMVVLVVLAVHRSLEEAVRSIPAAGSAYTVEVLPELWMSVDDPVLHPVVVLCC
jgi:hypothetical protein